MSVPSAIADPPRAAQAVSQDPRRWSEVVRRLARRQGMLNAHERQALLEGWFRLAVHPDTRFPEAVKLLHTCVRYDGSNPRYAYHLARLFFVQNRLELAARCLEDACRLCPTSHRLWSHACLL